MINFIYLFKACFSVISVPLKIKNEWNGEGKTSDLWSDFTNFYKIQFPEIGLKVAGVRKCKFITPAVLSQALEKQEPCRIEHHSSLFGHAYGKVGEQDRARQSQLGKGSGKDGWWLDVC